VWREVGDAYTLTPTEVELLHELCSAVDQASRIDAALQRAHMTSTGSQGQLTAHPLLNEARAHAEMIRRLVRQLALPNVATQQRKPKMLPRVNHLRKVVADG
jgi:hypothetical protein